ncbi:MAG: peptidase domain-containing ABC transporter [Candidatus Krumholzibacteriia bacterium]
MNIKEFAAVGGGLVGRYRNLRRQIPMVRQQTASDCGAAALTMVLRHFGRSVRLGEVRRRIEAGPDSASARRLLEVARQFGLDGRGVQVSLDDLTYLPRGSILHWGMNHFVVLQRVRRRGVEILDPAAGRRYVDREQLDVSFTGIALVLERAPGFVAGARSEMPTIWKYLARALTRGNDLSRAVFLSFTVQVLGLATPVLVGVVVDRIVPNRDMGLLAPVALAALVLGLFSFLTTWTRAHILLHLRTSLDVRMAIDFMSHLLRLPLSFFLGRQTGDLMVRLNSSHAIRETLTTTVLSAALDGTMVFLYLGVLVAIRPSFALIVLVLGMLKVAVYAATARRLREFAAKGQVAQAESANFQVQALVGIESVKSAGGELRALEHWSQLLATVVNLSLARGQLNALVLAIYATLNTITPLLLLIYGASLVLSGELTLGRMLAMQALAAGFLGPLASMVRTAFQMQDMAVYLERVEDIVSQAPEQDPAEDRIVPAVYGGIRLQDVTFRYPGSESIALDQVSLDISQQEHLAIVGPSGSGKSTLARILVGLFEPQAGAVKFDGFDIKQLDLTELRRRIGFVAQNPYLMATSVRQNIGFMHPDLGLDAIERAADLAEISEEIKRMPLGYDTFLPMGATSISGGQRQRIAIARALLGNPRILVLDEATSHLDSLTESRVYRNINALTVTRITIAHRLSSVIGADRIAVMDCGKIVELGRHDELLASDGLYSRLYRAQSG